MRRKRMGKSVYRGLRQMRAYINAALESAAFPEDEQALPDAYAAQEWLDDFLNAWGDHFGEQSKGGR